jgi:hypothetical protein
MPFTAVYIVLRTHMDTAGLIMCKVMYVIPYICLFMLLLTLKLRYCTLISWILVVKFKFPYQLKLFTFYNIEIYYQISNLAWLTTINHACKRSPLFWDVTQRRLVAVYGSFGTLYRSHLKRQKSPESSVTNCRSTLRNAPAQRRSHLHQKERPGIT